MAQTLVTGALYLVSFHVSLMCDHLDSLSVTELCEYAANVDIPIARESIRAVGKIALQQCDVNAIVDRLLQFLEMEKDYVTAEALVNNFACKSNIGSVVPSVPVKHSKFFCAGTCERSSKEISTMESRLHCSCWEYQQQKYSRTQG